MRIKILYIRSMLSETELVITESKLVNSYIASLTLTTTLEMFTFPILSQISSWSLLRRLRKMIC